jgi:hypothetical protein
MMLAPPGMDIHRFISRSDRTGEPGRRPIGKPPARPAATPAPVACVLGRSESRPSARLEHTRAKATYPAACHKGSG